MATSSTPANKALERCEATLRAVVDSDADAIVEPPDQLAAENAVAAGIAELAGETPPEPSSELPTRPILARDLLITVDLVRRALHGH